MSYPDEWEAEVEQMMGDLAESVPMPEVAHAIRMVGPALTPPILADAIVRDRRRRRSWGEALWTARDLLAPTLPLTLGAR